ncbi:hypothetical protein F2Q69_00035197 [Brassica cretica]|uniref:Uncharacterized protein n=1 Tax=Brassica cretica TaxID=69181 RepID=A0A8S9S9J3_BRACR|nr:hypothetical protein F2Q69_00035197 [Brassica cretica]
MATKRLIEMMSGYMKDKLTALTAPMANAYGNAVVFNKSKTYSRPSATGGALKRSRDFSL